MSFDSSRNGPGNLLEQVDEEEPEPPVAEHVELGTGDEERLEEAA